MTTIERRIATLSPEKRELLLRQLAQQSQPYLVSQRPEAGRREQYEYLPLSFAQQRLWFLEQLRPGEATYNVPTAFLLEGPLDVRLLERCVQKIAERHESLRTTFSLHEEEPVQIIAHSVSVQLPLYDVSSLSPYEREKEVQRIGMQEVCCPIHLEHKQLWRLGLLRLEPQKHMLFLCMHHIISDAWSFDIFCHELVVLYQAAYQEKEAILPPLPLQYVDYALWQKERLQGSVFERQIDYWRKQLVQPLPVLALSTDHPRTSTNSTNGAIYSFTLPSQLDPALRSLCQQEGVTLFMLLLAAFKVLLSRLSKQEDIIVGTPIANRGYAEIENIIGLFVNTLAIRTDLSGDPNFQTILQRVKESILGASAHQDVPFEKLVEVLKPERHGGEHPFFQVMFICQTAATTTQELLPGQLTMQPVSFHTETSKFDLTLFVWEERASSTITAAIEYNRDSFEQQTIVRLAEHYGTLLQGIVSSPQYPLSCLSLISENSRQQMLYDWNQTSRPYALDQNISQLFEKCVNRNPTGIALRFDNCQLSYAELNQRANQLAHYMRARGVRPGSRVGLYLERSIEMMVAVLGVLKVGGTYVPLDPSYPQERTAYMLTDAQLTLLLTQQHLLEELELSGSWGTVCLDTDWSDMMSYSQENIKCELSEDDVAYLIYTSGSTGRPKGVLVTQRGLSNILYFMQEQLSLKEQDIFLSVTTLCFDIAALELFLPLIAGACLFLVSRKCAADGQYLAATLQHVQPTYMQATPVTWNLLRLASWPGLSSLKMLCGGEPLTKELATYLLNHGERLWNVYGPTETTIWSTFKELHLQEQITIGHPLANTQVYILDDQLQLVPQGVPGELYIGGVALAHGYFCRSALTAERFLPNPFSHLPGQRIYRTGDLARFQPDGEIEHLGRLDSQVKVRGFRIELGEIEQILRSHPAVQDALAVVHDVHALDKRIIAYLLREKEHTGISLEAIKTFAKRQLPMYMLPSAMIWLDAFPQTPNGKVDRRSLPVLLNQEATQKEQHMVEPRDMIELQLARIFEDILNVHPVSITDNFFDLGGHSFLAMQLMSRLRTSFHVDLPLAALFNIGTIAGLAQMIRTKTQTYVWSPVVGIQMNGHSHPFFCVHPAGGSVLCYTKLARHLGPDQPFYGLQAYGLNAGEEPYVQVEAMATIYRKKLQEIQPQGPYFLGGWSTGGNIAFELAMQMQQQGHEVALLALFDTPAHLPDKEALDDTSLLLWSIKDAMHHLLHDQSELHIPLLTEEKVKELSFDEQVTYYLRLARSAEILPPDVETDQVRNHLCLYRSIVRAVQEYKPSGIFAGKITLMKASELPSEAQDILPDLEASWKPYSSQPLDIHAIPGIHRTLMDEPFVSVLAEKLNVSLNAAQTTRR